MTSIIHFITSIIDILQSMLTLIISVDCVVLAPFVFILIIQIIVFFKFIMSGLYKL